MGRKKNIYFSERKATLGAQELPVLSELSHCRMSWVGWDLGPTPAWVIGGKKYIKETRNNPKVGEEQSGKLSISQAEVP